MKYISLLLWIIMFEGVAFFIGQETRANITTWYAHLTKPPLVPPNYIFPIMWTFLYALIAAAAWDIWRHRATIPKNLIILFSVYVALNWGWSFVFFGAHLLLPGFIWIAVMNIIALAFIYKSLRALPHAAKLMILPTLWTFFAMYLNAGYWWVN